jgi:hypothetical protein
MAAINSTLQLAKIRSQIDAQQQIISQLEMELQMAILGSPRTLEDRSVGDIVDDIQGIYGSVSGGTYLGASFEKGVETYLADKHGNRVDFNTVIPEQDVIRDMLGRSRALLGELRIEEQSYVQEVNSEKESRKSLLDLAKG